MVRPRSGAVASDMPGMRCPRRRSVAVVRKDDSAMKRYAAFLRGVSPMNAKMPELKKAFEDAGFGDVRTVLSSGNVVFSAPEAPRAALEEKAETAMKKRLGSAFPTIVRPIQTLRSMLDSDPYQGFW